MKRKLALLLTLAMLMPLAFARADAPKISNNMFSYAKEALSLLSYGEYEKVSELLPFSGSAPDASEWKRFAGNFETINSGTVQRDISVAYWTGDMWILAVPVSEPSRGSVETLVLSSDDGTAFSGYKYAEWKSVKSQYEKAEYVVWNKEYTPSEPIVIADD